MRQHVHVSHYMIVSYREAYTQRVMSLSCSEIHNRAVLGSHGILLLTLGSEIHNGVMLGSEIHNCVS